VACDHKDAPDKGWVQIFYVYRTGADHFDQQRDTIKRWVWDMDQLYEASARRFGQGDSRRLRFVQDADCQIAVTPIGLSDLPAQIGLGDARGHADNVVRDQIAKGDGSYFARHKTVYLFDVDGIGDCGLGGGLNTGGLGGGFAAVSAYCFGEAALEHELGHSFGLNHCNEDHTQGNDPMCRGYDATPRCDDVMSYVFLDCQKDEYSYFNPHPAPGTQLAKDPGSNLANSAYLIKDQPVPPLEAQLVDINDGKCLTSGGTGQPAVDKPCGNGNLWRRTIANDGYFTLELEGTGLCLSSTPTDTKTLMLSKCAANDDQQHWWMDDAPDGAAQDYYSLVNKATKQREAAKERIAGSGNWGYRMVIRNASAAPSGTPSSASPTPHTDPASKSAPSSRHSSPASSAPTESSAANAPAASGSPRDSGSPTTGGSVAGGKLAKTGADTTSIAWAAVAASVVLGLGITLVLRTRRRSRPSRVGRGH
jgi:LPXTG-motif cell wall-anchored protein